MRRYGKFGGLLQQLCLHRERYVDFYPSFQSPKLMLSDSQIDWNPATTEQVLSGKHNKNPLWLHGAVKSLAEQEIWKFADEHPELDVTTSTYQRSNLVSKVQI